MYPIRFLPIVRRFPASILRRRRRPPTIRSSAVFSTTACSLHPRAPILSKSSPHWASQHIALSDPSASLVFFCSFRCCSSCGVHLVLPRLRVLASGGRVSLPLLAVTYLSLLLAASCARCLFFVASLAFVRNCFLFSFFCFGGLP